MKRWPTKTLGEIALIQMGQSPPGDTYNATGQGLPFFQGKAEFGEETPTTVKWCSQPSRVAEAGDILLSVRAPVGPTNFASERCCIGRGLAAIRAKSSQCNQRYLRYYLRRFEVDIASRGVGSTFAAINRSDVEKLALPLPPLAEQERIVNLLDEADELRKLRTQADRRTSDLIPALFHEMFGRHIKAPAVQTSVGNVVLPKGWRWLLLTDVARLATGHTPSRKIPEYWMGSIPWVSLTEIRALDGTVAQLTNQMVTEQGIANSSAVKLPRGTVCFSRTASVGFVTVMGREMCTSQDFVNWVCGDELDPIYLMAALMKSREHLRSLSSGSTHKTIYFPTVEQFCAVVPPIALQQEFAHHFLEINELKVSQATNWERLEDLFQSTLSRAFEGEL